MRRLRFRVIATMKLEVIIPCAVPVLIAVIIATFCRDCYCYLPRMPTACSVHANATNCS